MTDSHFATWIKIPTEINPQKLGDKGSVFFGRKVKEMTSGP
jgi:hypothetical protein